MSKKRRSKKSGHRRPTQTTIKTPSPTPDTSWKPPFPRNPWVQVLLVLILVFLVYLPSLFVPWYYDDYFSIVDKEEHRSLAGIRLILREFIHRGVVRLSYALDWHLSDWLDLYETRTAGDRPAYQKPVIYHLSSVGCHLVVVSGVFLLVRKGAALFASKRREENQQAGQPPTYLPAVVALLYGILPINTEAATYLSGRSSVLATGEYVFGIWAVLVAAERFGLLDENLGVRPRINYVIGTLALLVTAACFVLGIGTKEIIVTMPIAGLFILAFLIAYRHSLRTAVIRLVPVCALVGFLLVGFFTYRFKALGGNVAVAEAEGLSSWSNLLIRIVGIPDAGIRPWGVNLLSQIGVISLYYIPRQMCLRPLCIDPEVPEISGFLHPHVIFGVLILGGLIVLGVVCVRRAPLVTVGVAWYFISIAPTSSIIPLNDLAAERHTYLPNVGFVLAVVAFGGLIGQYLQSRSQNRAKLAKTFALLIGCICAFEAMLTIQRNLLYTDKIRLWEDAAQLSPGKARVQFHLAKEYFVEARRPENAVNKTSLARKAENACRAALEIKSDFVDAANLLGIIYMNDLKEYDKATHMFEDCIRVRPDVDQPWINLGTCYLLTSEFVKAGELARRWLKRSPNSVGPRMLIANSLLMQQRFDEAEACYLDIVRTHGENTTALKNLAYIARHNGDHAAAQQYEQRAAAVRQKEDFKPIEVHGKHETIEVNLP